MPRILCQQCQTLYPEKGAPFRCQICGGKYDFDSLPCFSPEAIESNLPGLWRYRHALHLYPNAPTIYLGEGLTPLLWDQYQGIRIGFKLESMNPTGSYKDRGTAVLISQLAARGVKEAIEDSSGNAGASFAAYANKANINARVFVPAYASGPKKNQIEAYGAELVSIPGPRSAATEAVLKETQKGLVYASHAYMPFGLTGIATIAYEIWELSDTFPGTIIAPVGHGGLLLGIVRGFQTLQNNGVIEKSPYFIGVQPAECAPMVEAFHKGMNAMGNIKSGISLSEGTLIKNPSQAQSLIKEIPKNKGDFVAVEEDTILSSYHELALKGIYVEPTSAIVWSAVKEVAGDVPEPIILIISGHGLKYNK